MVYVVSHVNDCSLQKNGGQIFRGGETVDERNRTQYFMKEQKVDIVRGNTTLAKESWRRTTVQNCREMKSKASGRKLELVAEKKSQRESESHYIRVGRFRRAQ